MKPLASQAISLWPSRRLQLILSLAHVVAAGAVLASSLPSWLAALLLLAVGASLARQRRPLPLAGLVLHGDGRLEKLGADGTASEARVHPHTVVLPFIVVLLFRQEQRLRSLVLLGDSLDAEDFRRLRLWLRWRAGDGAPA